MNWYFLVPLVFSVIVMIINSCKYCCRFYLLFFVTNQSFGFKSFLRLCYVLKCNLHHTIKNMFVASVITVAAMINDKIINKKTVFRTGFSTFL